MRLRNTILLFVAITFVSACGGPETQKKNKKAEQDGPPTAKKKGPKVDVGNAVGEKKATFRDDSKGQYGGGYISEAMRARVRTGERIEDLQLSHTLKNGWQMFQTMKMREPRSTEEFLDFVVKEMGAKLPPLEEGEEFHYDAKTDTLFKRVVTQPEE
jgi:hypothetical protein